MNATDPNDETTVDSSHHNHASSDSIWFPLQEEVPGNIPVDLSTNIDDNDQAETDSLSVLPIHSSFLEPTIPQEEEDEDLQTTTLDESCSSSSPAANLSTVLKKSALAMDFELTFSTTVDTSNTSSTYSHSPRNSDCTGAGGPAEDSLAAADALAADSPNTARTKSTGSSAKKSARAKKTATRLQLQNTARRRNRFQRLACYLAIIFIAVVIIVSAIVISRIKKKTTAAEASSSQQDEGRGNTDVIDDEYSATLSPSLEPPTFFLSSLSPSVTPSLAPSGLPSHWPSLPPSVTPTTPRPSYPPTSRPTTALPTLPLTQTVAFFAIGDVPYTAAQAVEMNAQIQALRIQDDHDVVSGHVFDFVIHIGDIRSGTTDLDCNLLEYQDTADILRQSPVPVFIVLGDNEWNDCPNRDAAWGYWMDTFQGFESRFWNHTFQIERMDNRPETFAFTHKGTLFIGLNLVGGQAFNRTEWSTRLSSQASWTMDLIRRHVYATTTSVNNTDGTLAFGTTSRAVSNPIVIFGHANPLDQHDDFFIPMKTFIRDELANDVPILYLNGDKHEWNHTVAFYDQPNWSRIMLTGGSSEPPLKVFVKSSRDTTAMPSVSESFTYDRQLPY